MIAPALQFLKETAADHCASAVEVGGNSGCFVVCPPKASGAPGRSYRLRISVAGELAAAREEIPRHLPKFCAERHINPGGSFCLSWSERDPLPVVNPASASRWWGTLLVFLNHQETAEQLKRWPGPARAHGQDAAKAQAKAIAAAESLGEGFVSWLQDGRLTAMRSDGRTGRKFGLRLDGKRLLTVDRCRSRVLGRRTLCPCRAPSATTKRIRVCGAHEKSFVTLTLALDAWKRAEAEYTRSLRYQGAKCCGTIRVCPLAV